MKSKLITAAKILLSVAIIWVIYTYFFHIENPREVWFAIQSIPSWVYFIGILSAIINWGIEARKWQVLLQQLESISYANAFRSTLSGTAVSNIFPFRIGEYLGRIVYLKPENRIPAAVNSVTGGTVQLIVAIGFGIPAASMLLPEKYNWLIKLAMVSVLGIPIVAYLIYTYFKNSQFTAKYLKNIAEDIRKFTLSQLLHVLWLSVLRYLVFASFYTFLLYQFQISAHYFYIFTGVACIYLLQSFAPSMAITDAGLRTGLPFLVFNIPTHMQPALLGAALINYTANMLVPSIIGLLFIVTQKIKGR